MHRLGVEPDDGPTLTALRSVRDGYMTRTPERPALVEQYYRVAPRIVSAIPLAHPDWDWIASRTLLCASLVRAGREPEAFVRSRRRLTVRPASGAFTGVFAVSPLVSPVRAP